MVTRDTVERAVTRTAKREHDQGLRSRERRVRGSDMFSSPSPFPGGKLMRVGRREWIFSNETSVAGVVVCQLVLLGLLLRAVEGRESVLFRLSSSNETLDFA